MMPPPHDPASPRAAAAPHAGRAAPPPPYTGGGTGTSRPARDGSLRLHKFACVAHICIDLPTSGFAAQAGCMGAATEEQHPPGPRRSPPRRGRGRAGGCSPKKGKGAQRLVLLRLLVLGQRWHLQRWLGVLLV